MILLYSIYVMLILIFLFKKKTNSKEAQFKKFSLKYKYVSFFLYKILFNINKEKSKIDNRHFAMKIKTVKSLLFFLGRFCRFQLIELEKKKNSNNFLVYLSITHQIFPKMVSGPIEGAMPPSLSKIRFLLVQYLRIILLIGKANKIKTNH